MISRRALIYGGLASSFLPKVSFAQNNDDAYWESVLQAAYEFDLSDAPTLGARLLPPSDPRWKQAKDILRNTPTSGNPYDVAVAIDQSISPVFRSEWPAQTANPLIVLFYVATKTKPDGDVTPWCAAFVSWCIERVGLESKHSAASQAYLNFGTEVWSVGGNLPGDAIEGDLCVFTNRFDPRRGHIAFFQRVADDKNKRIFVLGGNQTDSIKSSAYAVDGSLRLVKINRIV